MAVDVEHELAKYVKELENNVTELEAQIEQLLVALASIQYGSCDGCGHKAHCVECDGANPDGSGATFMDPSGHTDACSIGLALKGDKNNGT